MQYILEYKLSIMNTYFKKKNNQRWTWISSDEKTNKTLLFSIILKKLHT